MIGVLHQIPVALGLGLYHHTDFDVTVPANFTFRFTVGAPADFYGFLLHAMSFGDMLSNACDASVSQIGYEFGTKRIHPGILAQGSQPWMWVEPNAPLYAEITNLLAIPIRYQQTQWEVYFQTKDMMDLAKLAFWEFTAPSVYNLAVTRGLKAPIMGVKKLPIGLVKIPTPVGVPG